MVTLLAKRRGLVVSMHLPNENRRNLLHLPSWAEHCCFAGQLLELAMSSPPIGTCGEATAPLGPGADVPGGPVGVAPAGCSGIPMVLLGLDQWNLHVS
jgi:hypothetical protein